MAKRKNVLPPNNVLACFTVKHLPFGQALTSNRYHLGSGLTMHGNSITSDSSLKELPHWSKCKAFYISGGFVYFSLNYFSQQSKYLIKEFAGCCFGHGKTAWSCLRKKGSALVPTNASEYVYQKR